MQIKKQKNNNKGDVYNIETFNNNHAENHINIAEHTKGTGFIDKDSIEKCKNESFVFFSLAALGFLADISELFPDLSLPWWAWLVIVTVGFFTLAARHGDAFGLSGDMLQVNNKGELLVPNTDGFSKQESKAPCIYPNCKGLIEPISTPEGYTGPYNLMGQCSIAGKQHGYIIDDNLQAYKQDIYELFEDDEDTE